MSVFVTTSATVVSETGSLSLPRIGYDDRWRDATVTSSTDSDDYPADATQRPDTFEVWKPTVLSAWVQADLGASYAANYCAIAAHTIGTTGSRVTLQYSSNGSSWSNAASAATPSDDSAILLLFPQQTARYWRLLVDTAGSPSARLGSPDSDYNYANMPSVGVVYLGSILAMERSIYGGHSPITLSRDTELYQGLSMSGHFLGQSYRRRGFTGAAAFRNLTAAFVRNSFDPFVQAARRYPYFFAWRAGTWDDEVAYVWTPGDIRPSNMGISSLMQVQWEMRGYDVA